MALIRNQTSLRVPRRWVGVFGGWVGGFRASGLETLRETCKVFFFWGGFRLVGFVQGLVLGATFEFIQEFLVFRDLDFGV